MTKQQTTVEQDFIERFGLSAEADGLPRIAGRIMAYLLVGHAPIRASDLASELRVSHGSVSTNTRLLERLGIVERVSFSGDRAAYYQLTSDPYGRLLAGQLERMRRMQTIVADARRALPKASDAGRKNLAELERFYRIAVRTTEDLLEQLRAHD